MKFIQSNVIYNRKKRELSSTKKLAVEDRLLYKSFVCIKKNRGPKMDTWRSNSKNL